MTPRSSSLAGSACIGNWIDDQDTFLSLFKHSPYDSFNNTDLGGMIAVASLVDELATIHDEILTLRHWRNKSSHTDSYQMDDTDVAECTNDVCDFLAAFTVLVPGCSSTEEQQTIRQVATMSLSSLLALLKSDTGTDFGDELVTSMGKSMDAAIKKCVDTSQDLLVQRGLNSNDADMRSLARQMIDSQKESATLLWSFAITVETVLDMNDIAISKEKRTLLHAKYAILQSTLNSHGVPPDGNDAAADGESSGKPQEPDNSEDEPPSKKAKSNKWSCILS